MPILVYYRRQFVIIDVSTHRAHRPIAAVIAASRPMTLRLFPLLTSAAPADDRATDPVPDVQRLSSHFLKQLFMSRGAPSTTTVETGSSGLSSSDVARMP